MRSLSHRHRCTAQSVLFTLSDPIIMNCSAFEIQTRAPCEERREWMNEWKWSNNWHRNTPIEWTIIWCSIKIYDRPMDRVEENSVQKHCKSLCKSRRVLRSNSIRCLLRTRPHSSFRRVLGIVVHMLMDTWLWNFHSCQSPFASGMTLNALHENK